MGATHDAVEKISGVIRSLISLIDGNVEARRPSEHTPPNWQTTEEKANAARRLAVLRRRMAHCDRMTTAPKPSADDDGLNDLSDEHKSDTPL